MSYHRGVRFTYILVSIYVMRCIHFGNKVVTWCGIILFICMSLVTTSEVRLLFLCSLFIDYFTMCELLANPLSVFLFGCLQ